MLADLIEAHALAMSAMATLGASTGVGTPRKSSALHA